MSELDQLRDDVRRLADALVVVAEGLTLSTKGRGLGRVMTERLRDALELARGIAERGGAQG